MCIFSLGAFIPLENLWSWIIPLSLWDVCKTFLKLNKPLAHWTTQEDLGCLAAISSICKPQEIWHPYLHLQGKQPGHLAPSSNCLLNIETWEILFFLCIKTTNIDVHLNYQVNVGWTTWQMVLLYQTRYRQLYMNSL